MQLTQDQVKQFEYSNRILEIIDNADEFTRSDLQGVIDALVRKIMRGE